jgi:hypothetical protein
MKDWSYHEESILDKKIPHFYCTQCNSHYYKDRWYTKEEWFFYINETTHTQWLAKQEKYNVHPTNS